MSLILDALKRAERERRLEQAPDLTAVYDENLRSGRAARAWIYLGSGAVLIGTVVAGILLWPHSPSPDRAAVITKTSVTGSLPAPGITVKGERPVSNDPVKRPLAELVGAVPTEAALPSVQGSSSLKMAEKPPETLVSPLPKTKPESPPVETPDMRPRSRNKERAAAPTPPATDSDQTLPVEPATQKMTLEELGSDGSLQLDEPKPPSPLQVESVPEERPNKAQAPTVPLVSELPFEVREKLGRLQINVHSYSEKPDKRMVFINMKRFRTGDRIGEDGPVLKEITPEGAIIDYGGGQARLQVWR